MSVSKPSADAPPPDPSVPPVVAALRKAKDEGHWQEVIRLAYQLLEDAGEDPLNRARAYDFLSAAYQGLAAFDQALEAQYESLRIAERHDLARPLAIIHNNLGDIHSALGHQADAIAHLETALRLSRELGDPYPETLATNNLGVVYLNEEQPGKALALFQTALEQARAAGLVEVEVLALANLAEANLKLGHWAAADAFCTEGLRLASRHRYSHVRMQMARTQAESALHQPPADTAYARALDLLDHGLKEAEAHQNLFARAKLLQGKAGILEKKGDHAAALATYRQYHETREKELSEKARLRLENLRLAYQLEQSGKLAAAERTRRAAIEALNRELAATNAELDRRNREKNEVMGILAHDLRGPLGAIRGVIDILDEDMPAAERTEFLAMMAESSDHLLELVNRLLDVRALEAGSFNLQPERLTLAEALKPSLWYFRRVGTEKGITFETDIDPPGLRLRTDKEALRQIVHNLLSNAFKFTAPGKAVRFAARQDSAGVELTVEDEGPGISGEDQKKLFLPFQRLTAVPTGGEKSTGLGLAIVRRLVEAQGAAITCHSTPPHGTTFRVVFPAPGHEPSPAATF